MDYFFECSITPRRKYIMDLENKAEELFSIHDQTLKHQIRLVIMELLENAEKYSAIKNVDTKIQFKFIADDHKITIQVTNHLLTPEHYENLSRVIKRIQTTDNIEALYTSRLQALAQSKDLNESGLGLYRIAYEGKFQLSCDRKQDKVNVNACKRLE